MKRLDSLARLREWRVEPREMTMDLKEVNGRPIAKRGRIPGKAPTDRLVLLQG